MAQRAMAKVYGPRPSGPGSVRPETGRCRLAKRACHRPVSRPDRPDSQSRQPDHPLPPWGSGGIIPLAVRSREAAPLLVGFGAKPPPPRRLAGLAAQEEHAVGGETPTRNRPRPWPPNASSGSHCPTGHAKPRQPSRLGGAFCAGALHPPGPPLLGLRPGTLPGRCPGPAQGMIPRDPSIGRAERLRERRAAGLAWCWVRDWAGATGRYAASTPAQSRTQGRRRRFRAAYPTVCHGPKGHGESLWTAPQRGAGLRPAGNGAVSTREAGVPPPVSGRTD